jgi:hypothetical protein
MIQATDMAHAFPMIRAGGLFILVMGLGVTLGGVFSRQRKWLLASGGGAATATIVLCANALSRPLGEPTHLQFWALAGAILLELALVGFVVARYRNAGERTFLLAILFVVGVHFLPMAFAFGPLCAALGICAMANAGVGLWALRDVSLRYFWLMDGALKIAFGGLMLSVVSSASGA